MNTKFTSLVKLKKSEVEKLENHLSGVSVMIKDKKSEMDTIDTQISQTQLPMSGNIADLKQAQEIIMFRKIDKNRILVRVIELEDEKKFIQDKLKEANIELEKIMYLDEIEVKKIIAKKKKDEANELDEIATILYNRKKVS